MTSVPPASGSALVFTVSTNAINKCNALWSKQCSFIYRKLIYCLIQVFSSAWLCSHLRNTVRKLFFYEAKVRGVAVCIEIIIIKELLWTLDVSDNKIKLKTATFSPVMFVWLPDFFHKSLSHQKESYYFIVLN